MAVYPAPLAPHPHPYPHMMDREAGIKAFQDLLSPAEHKARVSSGLTQDLVPPYTADGDSPVIPVIVSEVGSLAPAIKRYRFVRADGGLLPTWTAGAHIDLVVAPEYLRPYSLCSDPEDRSHYDIAVLNEEFGRGGSTLLHRIFQPGRRVFIAPPVNHFPLADDTDFAVLLGGGIGISPMIAMAHSLHRQGIGFRMHYSVKKAEDLAFASHLRNAAWSDHVHFHVSATGTRADFHDILPSPQQGTHIYACGPDAYMQAATQAAREKGYASHCIHTEYFAAPEQPDLINHLFTLHLAKSGRDVQVAAHEKASDALLRAGVHVDLKCSDGLCGVCQCTVVEGNVDHRDFVLSESDRAHKMILCQSRAVEEGGRLVIDL